MYKIHLNENIDEILRPNTTFHPFNKYIDKIEYE